MQAYAQKANDVLLCQWLFIYTYMHIYGKESLTYCRLQKHKIFQDKQMNSQTSQRNATASSLLGLLTVNGKCLEVSPKRT